MSPDKQLLRFRPRLRSIAVIAVIVSVALLSKEAVSLGGAVLRRASALLPHQAVASHAMGTESEPQAGSGRIDYLPEHLHPAKEVDQSQAPTF